MKKESYKALVEGMSKLADKILFEEGEVSKRAKRIDGDIAVIVGEVGLQATKQIFQKTCDEKVTKRSRRVGSKPKQRDHLQCHFRDHGTKLAIFVA
jgi:hypothetical protein